MSQGSRDVAGGIWRFLIGLIVTPIAVIALLFWWCTDDADHHQPQQPTPRAAVAVSAAPPLPLPSVDVDATKIIGRSRQAIRKYLGKPDSAGQSDFFEVGEGISVEVDYYKGRAGQMAVTSSTTGIFHDSTRAQGWAHLPQLMLTSPQNLPRVQDYRTTQEAVIINGKSCHVTISDKVLSVLTQEFEQSLCP